MKKLKLETKDMVSENIQAIESLFPAVITEMRDEEGNLKKAVNFEMLKQLLSRDVVDGDECYEFTWVGKKASIVEANKPISKTLRPVVEDSRDWNTTENLYLEGDNLEVLKVLQESYLGKVKMIYIDPPYNTGNDFVYADDFMRSQDEENRQMGMYDDDGNRLFKNMDSSGKFHSDWCSMIYSRIVISRNLLTDDGVMFISIDDHEVKNLIEICNEVFGEKNYIGTIVWERAFAPKNDAKFFSTNHDFILVYVKNIEGFEIGKLDRTEEANNRYKNFDNDPRGPWTPDNLTVKTYSAANDYPILTPGGRTVTPSHGSCWRVSKMRFQELVNDNRIYFGADGNNVPRLKRFLNEIQDGMTPTTIWKFTDVGHNQEGRQELKKLFDDRGFFDGPKPTRLISRVLKIANLSEHDIVLDFFSGSATTAHAVMQLNAEDGGNRKFIMVQLQEPCDEKSEAYKAGYKNICEIGKERIRRAGDKIKAEHPDADIDIGFRVFRVDDSNMKDVQYHPEDIDQMTIGDLVENIKDDRNDLDLLYACLLDWGVEIHLPHTSEVIDGCTVHNVDNGALVACFDKSVPNSVVEYMAKTNALRAVFRDSAFESDADKINVTEIFKNLSPDTKVKVI